MTSVSCLIKYSFVEVIAAKTALSVAVAVAIFTCAVFVSSGRKFTEANLYAELVKLEQIERR